MYITADSTVQPFGSNQCSKVVPRKNKAHQFVPCD